jgi:hypothetical protein
MELRELGPDDASAIEAFVEVGNACRAVDARRGCTRTRRTTGGWR